MTAINALPEVHELAEQVGELVHSWGFKRIHGRLWTYLLLSDQPLDAADFVRLMGISKALVSITLRELTRLDVVRSEGKSARGTQLYKVNTNVQEVLTAILQRRERPVVSRVQHVFENLAALTSQKREEAGMSRERVALLGEWLNSGASLLDKVLRQEPSDKEAEAAFA